MLERKMIRQAGEAGHAQREWRVQSLLFPPLPPLATAPDAGLDLCKTLKQKKFRSAHLLLLHCVPLISALISFCFFVSSLPTPHTHTHTHTRARATHTHTHTHTHTRHTHTHTHTHNCLTHTSTKTRSGKDTNGSI